MKIEFFPCGTRRTASSRLRAYMIAEALSDMGHDVGLSLYNTSPDTAPAGTDVVVIQKRFYLKALAQHCMAQGIRVVFDCDDLIDGADQFPCDVLTTDTPFKAVRWPRAMVIPDVLDIEPGAEIKTRHRDTLGNVVWTGNAENTYHLANVAAACSRLNLALTVITDLASSAYAYYNGVSGVAWDVDTVDAELVQADLAVCPFVLEDGAWSEDWVKSKSANKLLKCWGLGLPVIGTPIPSYVEAGLRYKASTVDEWTAQLLNLRSPLLRRADAQRGYALAQKYRAGEVARRWLEVLDASQHRTRML